ncbi:SRPBCC family protein [uncultured Friedmanniella sp.]|uniref:SRPBCC family protein n=1 Tax=uncultured Friedmanniella sp. TaxID=335381 RepID=UPI0035C9A816
MTTSQTVSRTINAPATEIFDLLSNPERHAEFDGSGFVRAAVKPQRISAVGDTFRMDMEGPHMGGEYQMDNHVSGFQPNTLIAWKSAPAGTEPPGWEWLYELKAEGSGTTEVSLTYDWSAVTDKELLKKITFPLISEDSMEQSLASLAAAVNG